jgi:hypothetical protein
MAQGEDFCLQSNPRPERITKNGEQETPYREHHQSLCHIALSAIRSAKNEFLVGTTIQWKFTRKQARHTFRYIIKRSKH